MVRKSAVSALFALLLFVFGCAQKSAVNIVGSWHSVLVFEQELAGQNDDTVIAIAQIQQENTFVFREDGTFSRTVKSQAQKIHSFSAEVSSDSLRAFYGDNTFELLGSYSLKGTTLTLITDTIAVDGERMPYRTFFESTAAFGNPHLKITVDKKDENTILIQGVSFSRQ